MNATQQKVVEERYGVLWEKQMQTWEANKKWHLNVGHVGFGGRAGSIKFI